ncbi:MAG: hypothetical protein FRX48_04220 [Lasallia pustulata]|uniref:histidine kinase n=1 Tax=Lasallia pustulata TaxID=136370 RepID=A0A5M8PSX0_9LECA|nr:MAG: hypothetical protein FRX48_04220 [Lasallia pustulata]
MRTQNKTSKVDSVREREFYRYYNPTDASAAAPTSSHGVPNIVDPNTLSAHQASSPDTTLTALVQLCALRLHASRAMVSLISKETQYFIAESTKTLNLSDNQRYEEEGDGLWIGCATVSKEDRLCEKTIELRPKPGGVPCFTVCNLSQDGRFQRLPFVTGPPHFRFYAGTPLTTDRGVNIGSLFILDNRVRPRLNPDQEAFLGTVAQTVMTHLEMSREAEERRKAMQMSRGLNAFVEGRSSLGLEVQSAGASILGAQSETKLREAGRSRKGKRRDISDSSGGKISAWGTVPESTEMTSDSTSHRTNRKDTDLSGVSQHISSNGTSGYSTQDEAETTAPREDTDVSHRRTFTRAANLLRESLNLKHGGGVAFLDTTLGYRGREDEDVGNTTGSDETSAGEEHGSRPSSSSSNQHFRRPLNTFSGRVFSITSRGSAGQAPTEILGFSTPELNMGTIDTSERMKPFSPLGERALQRFLERYPRGKLWSFDEDGSLSSSEEELLTAELGKGSPATKPRRNSRKLAEAKALQKHFPDVQQLLFAPLWDAGAARWFSGCFCWSTTKRPVFSTESELSFIVAFGNSVMAEVSRLATITADQQKGDFIGSISHELRSPLHGILASAEFLGETSCDAFQASLVATIDSCGRTLLDTINHVLDFSKINSFERNWRSVRKPPRYIGQNSSSGRDRPAARRALPEGAPPLLNIYAVTDVAAICEEVVEGVYAGQIYQDISSTDISDITAGVRGKTSERGLASGNRSLLGGSGAKMAGKPIDVILDIHKADYNFTTQPGALRRVIMNVFGNALKYTEKGMILVKLELHDLEGAQDDEQDSGKLLVIKVIDTGKGISNEYLRTRLFTPFAQENVLAPGTGLGLSIVRSIINMLGGSIAIRSQEGQGTEVKISLPLMRVPGTDTPISTPSTAGSFERPQDDSVSILREQASERSVAFYNFTTRVGKDYKVSETGNVLQKYVSTWFGLKALSNWDPKMRADIVIVDEKDLTSLLAENTVHQSILVLCSNSSRQGQGAIQTQGSGVVELVSKPFGPYKLAKALRLCLERVNAIRTGLEPIAESTTIMSPRSDTLTGEFEELTLEGEDKHTPIIVQTNGTVIAGESANAQMAMTSSSSSAGGLDGLRANAGFDFPFPKQEPTERSPKKTPELPPDLIRRESRRPDLKKRATDPAPRRRLPSAGLDGPVTISSHGNMATSPESRKPSSSTKHMPPMAVTPEGIKLAESRPPRILVVDDNKINLRLLETFMTKRKYQLVDSAENGLLAVQAAEMQEDGYDIIFMGSIPPPFPPSLPPTIPLTIPTRHLHARHERLRSHPRHPRYRSTASQVLSRRRPLVAARSDHRSHGAGVQSRPERGVYQWGRSFYD